MANPIELYYTIKFLSLLTSSWKDTDAFKQGIIDEDGKLLVPVAKMTSKQKEAYSYFTRIVFNVKRTFEKLPFTKNKIASYAAALYLIKEDMNNPKEFDVLLEKMYQNLDKVLKEEYTDMITLEELKEEIANTSGGDNIAPYDRPHSFFARTPVFNVNADTYSKCLKGKRPYARWANYVDVETDLGEGIRTYAKKNPKSKILLRHEQHGSMLYLKR